MHLTKGIQGEQKCIQKLWFISSHPSVTARSKRYILLLSHLASPEYRRRARAISLGRSYESQHLIITRSPFYKTRIRMKKSPSSSTMQSRLSGYSDFFASGFRAILLARDPQPRSSTNSPTPSTSHLRRLSFSYKRTPAKRSKRDSFIEFSSSLTETLSSKTRPVSIEPSEPSYENIDPFTSSPDAKSIFIHSFDTTDPPPPRRRSTSKRDSSLSFSSPPKPKPKPRPVSMPIPITRRSWAQEEETETWTLNLDHFEEEEEDFAHRIDWRQFHVDVLLDE